MTLQQPPLDWKQLHAHLSPHAHSLELELASPSVALQPSSPNMLHLYVGSALFSPTYVIPSPNLQLQLTLTPFLPRDSSPIVHVSSSVGALVWPSLPMPLCCPTQLPDHAMPGTSDDFGSCVALEGNRDADSDPHSWATPIQGHDSDHTRSLSRHKQPKHVAHSTPGHTRTLLMQHGERSHSTSLDLSPHMLSSPFAPASSAHSASGSSVSLSLHLYSATHPHMHAEDPTAQSVGARSTPSSRAQAAFNIRRTSFSSEDSDGGASDASSPLPSTGVVTGTGNGRAAGVQMPHPLVGGKRGGGFSCHFCKTTKKNIDELFLCTNHLPKNPRSPASVAAALAANSDGIGRILTKMELHGNDHSAVGFRRCRKKYCIACIERLFPREMLLLRGPRADEWTCCACLNRCSCAGCQRKVSDGTSESPRQREQRAPSSQGRARTKRNRSEFIEFEHETADDGAEEEGEEEEVGDDTSFGVDLRFPHATGGEFFGLSATPGATSGRALVHESAASTWTSERQQGSSSFNSRAAAASSADDAAGHAHQSLDAEQMQLQLPKRYDEEEEQCISPSQQQYLQDSSLELGSMHLQQRSFLHSQPLSPGSDLEARLMDRQRQIQQQQQAILVLLEEIQTRKAKLQEEQQQQHCTHLHHQHHRSSHCISAHGV